MITSNLQQNYNMISRWCVIFACLVVCILTPLTTANKTRVTLGYLGPSNYVQKGLFNVGEIGSAVSIAIQDINNNPNLLPNHELNFIYNDSQCNDKIGLEMIEWQRRMPGVNAFIGPACSAVCEVGGLLASNWKLPIISYVSTSSAMSNHAKYDTFARTNAPLSLLVNGLLKVMDHFGWARLGILRDFGDKRVIWGILQTTLANKLDDPSNNYTLSQSLSVDLVHGTDSEIDGWLNQLRQKSRSK